jgi:hypothetical protein
METQVEALLVQGLRDPLKCLKVDTLVEQVPVLTARGKAGVRVGLWDCHDLHWVFVRFRMSDRLIECRSL